MPQLYLLIGIFLFFNLASCSTCDDHPVTAQKTTAESYKNPMTITFYSPGKKPILPYQVIAREKISRYNAGGIKRQEAIIHDMFQQLAAAMGGDAVIDFDHGAKEISGTVVKYKV